LLSQEKTPQEAQHYLSNFGSGLENLWSDRLIAVARKWSLESGSKMGIFNSSENWEIWKVGS
jgi:hypothetical protein